MHDYFGRDSSKTMPMHFLFGACRLDHATAIRADVGKQDYTVCPRHWYVDAYMPCESCGNTFLWSAAEQRAWFEEYRFYVDSRATRCEKCRAIKREVLALKKKYDATVSKARTGNSVDAKKMVVALIDQLATMTQDVPVKMRETRELLLKSGRPNHRLHRIPHPRRVRNPVRRDVQGREAVKLPIAGKQSNKPDPRWQVAALIHYVPCEEQAEAHGQRWCTEGVVPRGCIRDAPRRQEAEKGNTVETTVAPNPGATGSPGAWGRRDWREWPQSGRSVFPVREHGRSGGRVGEAGRPWR